MMKQQLCALRHAGQASSVSHLEAVHVPDGVADEIVFDEGFLEGVRQLSEVRGVHRRSAVASCGLWKGRRS